MTRKEAESYTDNFPPLKAELERELRKTLPIMITIEKKRKRSDRGAANKPPGHLFYQLCVQELSIGPPFS